MKITINTRSIAEKDAKALFSIILILFGRHRIEKWLDISDPNPTPRFPSLEEK